MVNLIFRYFIPGLLLACTLIVLLGGALFFPQARPIEITAISVCLAITLVVLPISLSDWGSGDLIPRLPGRLKAMLAGPVQLFLGLALSGGVALVYYPVTFTVIASTYFPPARGWELPIGLGIGVLAISGYVRGAYLCLKWYRETTR